MANKGQSQNSTQEELWLKQAQNKEFEFHLTNEWRQSDKFIEDTKKLFEYFHFNSERFHNNLVVDLGAGSRLRSKFFQGARIVAIEPLADRFLTQIEWSDLRDAWRLCSIPAEQFVDEVEGTADLIICINVLDHTFDPLAILRNARKYLKPDGQMLLSVDLHDSADEMHPIHLKESLLDELVLQAGFFIRRKYKGLPSSSSYGHGVAYTLILTPLEQLQISKDFLFVCSNSNQVLIFQPIAQELRKAGREPSFISLDQYYAQGASQKLQNMDFPWAELPSSNSNNNWFAMNLQQRQILEMSANRAIEASFLAQLPRCIVVGNDIGVLESSFLSLAKSHQVSTVLVQDGLYWTSSKADIKEHAAQGTQGCDLVCTWGAGISKRLMDLGVSSKVVITGNPRYDLVNDRSTELPLDSEVLNTKIKILVAGQCFAKYGHMSISDEKLMYKRLLSLLANKEDVHIYFKLHPQQDEAYYKPLLEEQIHKITLITSGDSISLLKQMDVLVTINSTVAVEAILCRVPTILMNYLVNIRTPPDFEDYPFLYHDEKQFLHDYMKHEFPKNIGLSDAFFEKFVDLTVHKLDGNAAIRIKNALIYLVDQVNEPEISVLLCSYNRAETLKLCLDALQHQTLDKSQFEVICVNDGSTDHTGVVMQTALKTLPGSYHEHSTNKALAAARNTALRAAKGKYFLFINDDTIAASDMLEQHLAAHQAHYGEKLAVLGDFRFPVDWRKKNAVLQVFDKTDLIFAYPEMKPGQKYGYMYFWTANVSVPRQVLSDVGEFDEIYKRYGVEDTEWGYRLEQAGYQVLYHPAASAQHFHDMSSIDEFCRRQRRVAANFVIFFKSHIEALVTDKWKGLSSFSQSNLRQYLKQQEEYLSAILAQAKAAETINLVQFRQTKIDEIVHKITSALNWLHNYHWHAGLLEGLEKIGCDSFADFQKYREDDTVQLSIIIPTHNRSDILAKCLDALQTQTIPPQQYEVIVCDDGSTDDTHQFVQQYQSSYQLYYLTQQNAGPAAARNAAMRIARGRYFLFLNDDAIAAPDLLGQHLAAHRASLNQKLAVLGSFDFPQEWLQSSPILQVFTQTTLIFGYADMVPGEKYGYMRFWTANVSVPREAYEEVGGFDQIYEFAAVEDTEWGYRLEQAGYKVLYHPSAKTTHLHDMASIEKYCHRQHLVAANFAHFFNKHPQVLATSDWQDLRRYSRAKAYKYLRTLDTQLEQVKQEVRKLEQIDLIQLVKAGADTKQLLSTTKDVLFFLNDYYWNQGLLDGLEQYGFDSFADFNTQKPEKTVKISVIIPTYNRSTTLKKCLDALTQQSLRPDTYEVIICDDGSTDDTAKMVSYFTASFKLHYLSQSNKGPAAARNLGIKKAEGDYLLFMNDDTIAAPDLLLAHYQTHQNNVQCKISVLGTFKLLPEHNQSLFTHVLEQSNLLFGYAGMEAGNLYNYTRFYTCNLSLPRQAVIDVGSFDEDFNGPAAEDLDLGYRLQHQGYRVLYQPHCIAWHDHRLTPEEFCKTHVTRGLGAVVLFLKHPEISDFKDITLQVVAEWRQQQASSEEIVNQLLHQLNAFTDPLLQASVLIQQQDALSKISKAMENLWLLHYRKGVLSSPWLNKLLETTLDFDQFASKDKQPKPLSPKVSVVIPCYNYAHYLSEAVDSVLSQTYQNFEIIIVNDGSTDDTHRVTNQLIARNPKQRIRLIQQSNSGQPAIARNVGITQAVGQYILCLDADDKLEPTFLEKTVSVLDSNPEISIAFTHIQHFGSINSIWSSGPLTIEAQIRSNNIPYCALYRRMVFDSVNGYATNVRGYEDWDFWLNVLEKGWQGQLIPEPLFFYRKGHESVLGQANQNGQELMAQIILNHPALFDPKQVIQAQNLLKRDVMTSKKYRITYLITSILGVTGGNQTLLQYTNYLTESGHDVAIVTYTDTPTWFDIKAQVIKVPKGQNMARYVPPSDVVVSTYFMNTAELLDIDAPVKFYFAQGDQYIFADDTPSSNPQVESLRRQMQELSKSSYFLPDVHFVANSHNLARTVEKNYGRKVDAIIPTCIDQTLFRSLPRAVPGSRWRILIVGPDAHGSDVEPLTFKGISDIKEALQLLSERFTNFTAIRMSSSPPDIFKNFPCEFYVAPPSEIKTFLYGTAHILLYASHYDSCPLPPKEAMAAGAVVICTSTSGAMEYCVHEENCLLVPIKSPSEIAKAIERLITDPELREKLIQGGFSTAQEYPRERAWHKLEAVIDQFVVKATIFPASSTQDFFTNFQPVDSTHRHAHLSTVSASDRKNGHHLALTSSQVLSNKNKPVGDTMAHDEILNQMITSAQTAGNWPQAISLLKEAVKYAPLGPTQANIWNSLGYSFFQTERMGEAESAFLEGIQVEPQNMSLLKNLIDLYQQQDQLDKATEYINQGLRIDPDDTEILLSLGECAIQLGAFDVAEMAFVRIKALAPNTAGIDDILDELFGIGQPLNGNPNGTDPSNDVSIAHEASNQILAKGQVALKANDLTEAAQEFSWVVAQYPNLAAGHAALGGALLALGQVDAAIIPLRRVIELLPELAAGYNQLGIAYYRAGHQTEAEKAFKQAHHFDPLDLEPCLNLIDLYRGQRHFEEARTMVDVASRIDPNHPEVQIAAGLVNAEMGNFDEARHSLVKLEEVAPKHPGVTALRSLLNKRIDQVANLIPQIKAAQSAGNWFQAIDLLKNALTQPNHQSDPILWNSLAVSYFNIGQVAEAETAMVNGLKFNPDNLDLLSNLADLYLQQEQFDRATEYVNKVLQSDPNHVEALIVLGQCCIRLNVFDTALTAFRRVAELAPNTEGVDQVVVELESIVAVPG